MTLPGRPSDLRDHPKFKEVWELFCRVHEPALGRLRHATQLAPSPDGRSIVFAGNVQQRLDDVSQERLGIVDLSDGIARNLDTATGSASRPAWSRDGVLAYVSQGTHVVCGDRAIDVPAGGIAEEIAWSRDAQRLLVRLAGKGADAPGAAGSGSLTSDAGRAATWLPYVEGAFADDAWRRASVVDVRNGRTLWSSPPGDNVWEAVWCGDFGVVAVVSDDPTESSWYRSRLVYYDTQSAQRRELYRGMEEMGVPAASPDGRYVTVVEACCSDRMLVAGNLTLLDLERKPLRPQTLDALGIDVTHAVWRDAHRLLFAGLDRMDTVVGEYDVRSDRSHEIWRSGESVGAYSPVVWTVGDGDAFAAVVDSYGRYQRIVLVERGEERTICDLAHDGTNVVAAAGGRCELVSWTGRDGLEIDGMLVLPAGNGPFPLVINVHGGPVFSFRNQWEMHYYHVPLLAQYGYAVLNPNPRGSRGRGQEFARYVRGDMCGEDTHDILRGIDALIERNVADPERLAVMGRSYGGYMSSWLVTQTARFAAAISMAPVTDAVSHHFTSNIPEFDRRFWGDSPYASNGMYAARSPVLYADRASTPTLSMAGARDRCTPPTQALEFHRALAENGVTCELVIYPEEGHHVDRLEARADQMTRILLWLERFMPAA